MSGTRSAASQASRMSRIPVEATVDDMLTGTGGYNDALRGALVGKSARTFSSTGKHDDATLPVP